jgi:hypothetical protein
MKKLLLLLAFLFAGGCEDSKNPYGHDECQIFCNLAE